MSFDERMARLRQLRWRTTTRPRDSSRISAILAIVSLLTFLVAYATVSAGP